MSYVDGFVFTLPKKNIKAYKKMAALGGKIWMKHGAVQYVECLGDDLKPKWAELTFPKLTKMKPTETVGFSFIIYKSKKHRDQVNAKVMKDPSMNSAPDKMPFEMNKMAVGGFETVVER